MKVICLMSGGIDSPAAACLMLERGAQLIALHMDNRPFTDKRQQEKVADMVALLERRFNTRIPLKVAAHGPSQAEFARECKRNLECVLCRRMMLRVAQAVARQEGAQAIVTGESLGQVASQTLRNIRTEDQAIEMPVLRPLIGLDKLEIEAIAKRCGTYDVSIQPGLCCTIVPDKPSTHSDLGRVLAEENGLDMDALVDRSMDSLEKQDPGDAH